MFKITDIILLYVFLVSTYTLLDYLHHHEMEHDNDYQCTILKDYKLCTKVDKLDGYFSYAGDSLFKYHGDTSETIVN